VISTDASTDPTDWSGSAFANFPNNGAGSLLAYNGNDRYITNSLSTSNAIAQFQQNARLGTIGNGAETGLLSLMSALNPGMLSGWNQGFVRDDAMLAMIVVSDEDESNNPSDQNYLRADVTAQQARINAFKSMVAQLKPNRPELLRFDAIVAPSKALCPTVGTTNGVDGTGDTYIAVANALARNNQPHVMNICQDFSTQLGSLGSEMAVTVERTFHLTTVPYQQTMVVKLNGTAIPMSATDGFTYNAATNEITLHGLNLESLASFDLRINYVKQ